MRNRPQISHVPKKDGEDNEQCPGDDHALIIWHENYPFGMWQYDSDKLLL